VIRFGNIIGSRGSVLPIWQEQMEKYGKLRVTGLDMVRWWIGVDDAARFICDVAMGAIDNEAHTYVPPNMMHMKVVDVMRSAFGPDVKFDLVDPKPGEKQDEQLWWPHERHAEGTPSGSPAVP
jgi:UDP-N-acetylglucosamine 4,6-dehydratase